MARAVSPRSKKNRFQDPLAEHEAAVAEVLQRFQDDADTLNNAAAGFDAVAVSAQETIDRAQERKTRAEDASKSAATLRANLNKLTNELI